MEGPGNLQLGLWWVTAKISTYRTDILLFFFVIVIALQRSATAITITANDVDGVLPTITDALLVLGIPSDEALRRERRLRLRIHKGAVVVGLARSAEIREILLDINPGSRL